MRVLGVDPGTLHLGWGAVERVPGRVCHVDHGVIDLDSKLALEHRLVGIFEQLDQVIERVHPDMASVETLFFHRDAQAAAKLGHARGVVLLCLARRGTPVSEYQPARVKRALTGSGRAGKDQVAQMVRAALGLPRVPRSDAADALALAITHLRLAPLGEALARASTPTLAREQLAALLRAGRRRGRSRRG